MRPLDAVRRFLRREDIRGVHICCALSGGADSICLLHCLRELRAGFELKLSAVHIQHGLRGGESLRDEQFCVEICETWGIPLTVIPVDVKGMAAERKLSTETAARECRYAAFAAISCDFVATAHTASDQIETVLFRMARGTGLRGLCGIPPVRDRFIRPLLDVTREEILAYLRENELLYVTDSTNLSDDYSRNFIRHTIVPPMQELNPGAALHITHMTASLREDADFLQTAADAAYQTALQPDGSLRGLTKLHPALQKRCIARFLGERHFPHGYEQITAAAQLLRQGGSIDPDRSGRLLCASRDTLFVRETLAKIPEIPLQLGENVLFPGFCVTAEVIGRENADKFSSVHKKFTDFVLDYDIIKKCVALHGRKPGLRMQPAGRAHHVSIKKWLSSDVPPAQRQFIHFLSDSEGLIWAEGLGADDRVKVTDATQRILFLQIHRMHTEHT